MPIVPGTRLGPYEILAPAGEGGMGVVYKAQDTRLKRLVALKIIKARFSERFEREAKLTSSLNHPHVCTVYDVGVYEGAPYLVMEYVAGKPLNGPLPLSEALGAAIQIADALAAAHAAGIVHRDLKPMNILQSADGVKLLDFGLARLVAGTHTADGDRTQSLLLTGPGEIMGTPQYMAPEQIEGKDADSRTDLFAFGLVLYELLTGERAFHGESSGALIAAILREEPPAVPGASPALQRTLNKCLMKDPTRRWQTAVDLRDELQWLAAADAPAAIAPSRRPYRVASLVAGFCAAIALCGWVLLAWVRTPALQAFEFAAPPSPGSYYVDPTSENPVAQLSPDGSMLVIAASAPGQASRLWLRRSESGTFQPLDQTAEGRSIAWSPDSKHIAFVVHGQLMRLPVAGGPAQTLCDMPTPRPLSWSERGYLLTTDGKTGRLLLIPESGGEGRLLGELDGKRHETHTFALNFSLAGLAIFTSRSAVIPRRAPYTQTRSKVRQELRAVCECLVPATP